MTSSRIIIIQLALFASAAMTAASESPSSSSASFITFIPDCNLDCQHGGTCSLRSTYATALERDAQQGNLIMECNCPLAWGGLACEIPRQECHGMDDNDTCRQGLCLLDPDGVYRCASPANDCRYAEELGVFAAKMCRQPYTEYCPRPSNATATDSTTISFCTNGGK